MLICRHYPQTKTIIISNFAEYMALLKKIHPLKIKTKYFKKYTFAKEILISPFIYYEVKIYFL